MRRSCLGMEINLGGRQCGSVSTAEQSLIEIMLIHLRSRLMDVGYLGGFLEVLGYRKILELLRGRRVKQHAQGSLHD